MSELKAIMSIKCSVTESGVGDVEYVSHNVPAHLKKYMETELLEGAKELATEKQLGESIKFFVEMSYTIDDLLEASPGPRVTEHQVGNEAVTGEYIVRGCLTICILTLKNGFTVVGTSSCASPENFNEEIGRHYALKDAERQVWPLLGFRLKDQLHKEKEANDLVAGLSGGDDDCVGCKI